MEKNLNFNKKNQEEEDKEQKGAAVIVKRQKHHKKRLLLLLLLLLLTGVMLGTSTYAWFTSNKTVNVNNITVNVAAQNGIQLSVDGTTWKSIIQTSDIKGATAKYAAAVNQVPQTVEPVSTIGTVDSTGKMEMYYGVVAANADGAWGLTATRSTEVADATEGKFVAFDLFFKVDDDTDIYMTSNSGVVASATGTDSGIQNASRIGFVILGNTSAGSSLDTIQALNEGTSSPSYIWEPNYDIHTATGVNNARDVYGITTTETGGAQLSYDGIKAEITSDNGVTLETANVTSFSTLFGTVSPEYATIAEPSTGYQMFSLTKGVTKVRVYMWIEGQDVDCENNASGGEITYNLQISTENS